MLYSALLAVVAVNLLPILAIILGAKLYSMICTKKKKHEKREESMMTLFTSFSAGALLADVFMHLLGNHDHHAHQTEYTHHHHHEHKEFAVLAGIALFFSFDLFDPHSGCHSHSHSHSESGKSQLSSTLAGAVHCFSDGATIAAAFLQSQATGLSTCLAMLLHEIPHRMRDILVLKLSPVALGLQIAASMAGAAVAITFGQSLPIFKSVVPFAAGGFIYLSMSGMMPQVLQDTSTTPLLKTLAFLSGITLITLFD